jgi:L-ascorbate metabolism protein UlaG (beta-lactamase superfamily)
MEIKLTWLGHSTWQLGIGEHRLIIDPFLTQNPVAKAEANQIEADYVLLTHGHFDHVADAAEIANRNDALLIANYEIATWFSEKHGVKKTLGMNLGGAAELPFGRLKMTIAFHSSQLPDGSYGGNPGGFVIEASNKRLYFAGDTAIFSDMKLIGEAGLDLAVLPIGDLFTMGIDDSVAAAKLLNAKSVSPNHYNTWPPIEQDVEKWAQRIQAETDSKPVVLQVGQTVTL